MGVGTVTLRRLELFRKVCVAFQITASDEQQELIDLVKKIHRSSPYSVLDLLEITFEEACRFAPCNWRDLPIFKLWGGTSE